MFTLFVCSSGFSDVSFLPRSSSESEGEIPRELPSSMEIAANDAVGVKEEEEGVVCEILMISTPEAVAELELFVTDSGFLSVSK